MELEGGLPSGLLGVLSTERYLGVREASGPWLLLVATCWRNNSLRKPDTGATTCCKKEHTSLGRENTSSCSGPLVPSTDKA